MSMVLIASAQHHRHHLLRLQFALHRSFDLCCGDFVDLLGLHVQVVQWQVVPGDVGDIAQ